MLLHRRPTLLRIIFATANADKVMEDFRVGGEVLLVGVEGWKERGLRLERGRERKRKRDRKARWKGGRRFEKETKAKRLKKGRGPDLGMTAL